MLQGKIPLIKLLPGEKLIAAQRQHVVALLAPVSAVVVIFLVFFFGLVFALYQINIAFLSTFILYLVVLLTVLLVAMSSYLFAYWYFQFYIVTNQRLMHIHFFRFGGFHMDEVAYADIPKAEVECRPSNPLYDLLNVEDVYVYFRRTDRPEPFVFNVPADAEAVENLLEEIVTRRWA